MIHTSLPYKYLGRYVSQVPRLSIQITGVAITQLVIYALVYLYSPRISQNNTAHLHGREYSAWSVSSILDLISNVPLSLVAGAGILLTRSHINAFHSKVEQTIWINMFLFTGMLAVSSMAYIISPDNLHLLIVRGSFIGASKCAFGLVMYQYLGYELVSITSLPIILEGMSSVLYAYFFNDLRWFFAVQVVSVVLHLIFTMAMPTLYSKSEWLAVSLACQVVARSALLCDQYIHRFSDGYFSGNALASLLTASQFYCLYAWLSTRSITRQMTRTENIRTR
jgi:hypothetical protein